ncbi:capsular polysaccharide export protein, LipB/KpsS family [Sediminicola luteus]|uniref:Capsule polysaccharide biosynthesis protein n=1 Tax=Sediminicola luteus TaxID=319238 RepID=A0A2A4GFJ8_9FLAO|nr:hypothetical protein [Sediminicola luteus]PCE66555.1 hypothetical protein B7P33_04465 [Sediminicola luteus]
MKIVFIENRYKTKLYEAIARRLPSSIEVYWLVQNHSFVPKTKNIYCIPYPSKNDLSRTSLADCSLNLIIQSDRQQNFFKKKGKGYFHYYYNQIKEYLEDIMPDFIFGESTAFHELLTIEVAKRSNLIYLNPSTCRYPKGRFSFYKNDSLEPYKGSNEVFDNEELSNIISGISSRNTIPDYMNNTTAALKINLKNKIILTSAYFKGESYNTPNPFVKKLIERRKRKLIRSWDNIACDRLPENSFLVLYPMQMQPEANIDVWGRAYRNQTDTIIQIAKQLGKGQTLIIKPNPKSKYEINEELIDFASKSDNIVLMDHSVEMKEIIQHIDLVVTVTGTIAIECILSNKPVVTLVETLFNKSKNCVFLDRIKELPNIIMNVTQGTFPVNKNIDMHAFVSLMTKSSYPGIISDPLSDRRCVDSNNITDLVNAWLHVIEYS